MTLKFKKKMRVCVYDDLTFLLNYARRASYEIQMNHNNLTMSRLISQTVIIVSFEVPKSRKTSTKFKIQTRSKEKTTMGTKIWDHLG